MEEKKTSILRLGDIMKKLGAAVDWHNGLLLLEANHS